VAFSERENEAGRLLLRLAGETLIRVDCEGRTRPSLATRWSRDAGGTIWTFQLDSSLTSEALTAQWDLRRNGGLWPWKRILEVRALPGQIQVRLDSAFDAVPEAFAIPQLSVAPSRVAGPGALRVMVHSPALDERDLLDRPHGVHGVDVLITRDRAALSYGGSKPGFSLVPLPWDRTYVVVAPVVYPELGPDVDLVKQSIAREVLRSDSRVAAGPFWWETSGCGTKPPLPMGRRKEVVYLQGDQTAREIAERLVALQQAPGRATSLAPDAYVSSLAAGEAAMYVVALPRSDPGSCREQPAWPTGSSVVALVDSRAEAIVRDGVPPLTVEGDGTIRFEQVRQLIPSESPRQ
jgi:hypothetical protein